MKNFEKQKKTYNERIRQFVGYLKKENPLWIKKRSWFVDLKKFELEQNFFQEVFHTNIPAPKDKSDFETGILSYASIKFGEKIGDTLNDVKCGFYIEPEIDDAREQDEHESLLGYLWWITIYKKASRAGRFSKKQKVKLTKKRKEFIERIKTIELLSY